MRLVVTLSTAALLTACAAQPAFEKGRYLVLRSELTSNVMMQVDLFGANSDLKPEACGYLLNLSRLSRSKGDLYSCTFQSFSGTLKAQAQVPVAGSDKPLVAEFRDLAVCHEYARETKGSIKESDCKDK